MRAPSRAAGAVLLLLLVFVVWPLARVVATALAAPSAALAARAGRVLVDTVAVAAVSTVLTVGAALVLAYAVTRTDIPGKRLLSLLTLLPLVSPPFVAGLAVALLAGRQGALTRALGLAGSIEGFAGIVVAQVFTFLPQAYIVLSSVLGDIDASLEEAAESLGATRLAALRRITLALARPGLASALLIVFILCLGDLGNPLLVGGRYPMLATEIYAAAVGAGDLAAAGAMAAALLVPCLTAYAVLACALGTGTYATVSAGARTGVRPTPPGVRWPLLAVAGGLTGCVGMLHALIPLGSVARRWPGDWSLSTTHYAAVAAGAASLWTSVAVALASGAAGTVVALAAAYVVARQRAVGRGLVEALALAGPVVPGAVVGLGYLLAFGAPDRSLVPALGILVASVVFWKLPVAARAGIDALRRIDPSLEEAAVSLGAGRVATLRRILSPLLGGTAASIFVYFSVNGMVTVDAVIFLLHPGLELGAVAILTRAAGGDLGGACAFATLVLALAVGPLALVRALVGGDRLRVLKL